MKKFFTFFIGLVLISGIGNVSATGVSSLEDVVDAKVNILDLSGLNLQSESSWFGDENGDEGVNDYGDPTFTASFGDAVYSFNNSFSTSSYGNYWSGFAYTNTSDITTVSTDNLSAITGGGYADNIDDVYVTAFLTDANPAVIKFSSDAYCQQLGLYVTNAAYTYHVMKDGNAFAKKFGGVDGSDPDWLKLTAIGCDLSGNEISRTEIYLADFRSDDPEQDYILNEWTWFDLSSLGSVASIRFAMSSSDTGDYGMNTPAYFCLDAVQSVNSASVGIADDGVQSEADAYYIDGSLYLKNLSDSEVRIVSMTGAIMGAFVAEGDLDIVPIDLTRGNYIIQAIKNNEVVTFKIVVK